MSFTQCDRARRRLAAIQERATPWLVVVAAVGLTASCSQRPAGRLDRAAVSGSITFDGKPLPGGLITFCSARDTMMAATAVLQPDGTYFIEDAPLGANLVTVDTTAILAGAPQRYVEIPKKYIAPDTAGLTYEVHAGDNEKVDFQLSK